MNGVPNVDCLSDSSSLDEEQVRTIVRMMHSYPMVGLLADEVYNVFVNGNTVLALSKYGSRGAEVTQIQTKLKRWGYYKKAIDGIYGSGTREAVKYFQISV